MSKEKKSHMAGKWPVSAASHRRRLKRRREDTKTFKPVWRTDACYVAEREA